MGRGVREQKIDWQAQVRADLPVGGRLAHFVEAWRALTSDRWVLEVVESGYCIEFATFPPPSGTRQTPLVGGPGGPLGQEVSALLEKHAIEAVPPQERGQGFYSGFFLRPKKSGALRPILNLKPLNQSVARKHFRMDNLQVVLEGLQGELWGLSIDLTDAYLHVPIRPQHKRYLRFALQDGRHFQFRCLCFGLSSAPRVFTKLVAEVGAKLREEGVKIYQYLDDWLIVSKQKEVLLRHRDRMLELTRGLGFIVNLEKSHLEPSQDITFLGVRCALRQGLCFPTLERLEKLEAAVQVLVSLEKSTARDFLVILGMMSSLIQIVPWARLHMRPIQLSLLGQWKPSSKQLEAMVSVRESVREHLLWWLDRSNTLAGVKIKSSVAQVTLFTDASRSGWGGFVQEAQAQGTWTKDDLKHHINWLELKAVWLCLIELEKLCLNKTLMVRSDNTTVVSYLNKQGGTRSGAMMALTWGLLKWCQARNIEVLAAHVAGVNNRLADLLSRRRVNPSEWQLDREAVQELFRRWGRPNVDLFASRQNAQLPTFCSWRPDAQAYAIDSLAISWTGMEAYAFPPIALVSKVLAKLKNHQCRLILIAPWWPRRPWFTELLGWLRDIPLILPKEEGLLTQQRGQVVHPNPSVFGLVAWPLSSKGSEIEAFRKRLQSSSRGPSDGRQAKSMRPDTNALQVGVTKGASCPIQHLYPR